MYQCMGSIDKPITRYTDKHIYRRDTELRVKLDNGIELHGVPNSGYTFVVIDDTEDSIDFRNKVQTVLETEVFWFCPAPIPKLNPMNLVYFMVGCIFIMFEGN